MWDVEPNAVSPAEAIAWFRARVSMTPDEYRALEDRARRKAFTVAGVMDLDLLNDTFKALDKAVAQGTTFETFVKDVGEKLEATWGKADSSRLQTIFSTNVQSAYSAGRWRQLTDPDVLAERPYHMYDAVLDGRTSELCKHLDGTTLPADDPFWETHTPPLHFNSLAEGTLITTLRGVVPIQEVQPDDLVLTHRGRWRRVYTVMSKQADVSTVRELHFSTGTTLAITNEHPVLTSNGWKTAGKLEVGDKLFQHGKPVSGLFDVARLDPNDFPPPLDEPAVPFEIAQFSLSRLMSLAVNLEGNFQFRKGEVDNVGLNDKLDFVGNAALVKKIHGRNFGNMRMLAHPLGMSLAHTFSNFEVAARVVLRHALRCFCGPNVAILFAPVSPVLFSARFLCRLIRDRSLGSLSTNGYVVPFTPTTQCSLPEAKRPFDCSDGLSARPVSFVDESFDSSPVSNIKWFHPTIISIVEVPVSRTLWNLAVEEDETYLAESFIVHNCRSGIISLTESQAAERGVTKTPPRAPAASGFGLVPDKGEWQPDLTKYPQELQQAYQAAQPRAFKQLGEDDDER